MMMAAAKKIERDTSAAALRMARSGALAQQLNAIESLVNQPNAGDCVLFGAYDGYDIVSFDDQVGAHGSAGGDQVYPFLISPSWLRADTAVIEDARDLNRVILRRYPAER